MKIFCVVFAVAMGLCLPLGVAAEGVVRAATLVGSTAGPAADGPLRSFRFGHLVTADALNDHQLVVRTWPSRLWLLTVEDDCNLTHATSRFHVTSLLNTVRVGRDRVLFASSGLHGACGIRQMDAIDTSDMASDH